MKVEVVGDAQIIEVSVSPLVTEIQSVNAPIELLTGGVYSFVSTGFNHCEILTATNGQTVFQLANTPLQPNQSLLFVNGQKMGFVTDYMVDGSQLTWLDSFELSQDDRIDFYYN